MKLLQSVRKFLNFQHEVNHTSENALECNLEDVRVPAGSDGRPIAEISKFLEDLHARQFRPQGIIDVGANYGNWTNLAKRIFPNVPIIMIEPQVELRDYLAALCDPSLGIDLIQAGVGAKAGEAVQTIWDDLSGSSFLPDVHDNLINSGKQRVTPIVTLDSILASRPSFEPDLVKLDIQGYELEALRGGESLFGKSEIFIVEVSLFEFMPRQPILSEVVSFFAERNYCLYDIPGFLRRPSDGALGQLDLAFVKDTGRFRSDKRW